MKDTGLRGLALLDAAITQIETHPETWVQAAWRCETGMCVAGWICELAGGQWAGGPEDDTAAMLIADPDEPASYEGHVGTSDRAQTLLGFDMDSFETYLFSALNDLADIKRIRDAMAKAGLK